MIKITQKIVQTLLVLGLMNGFSGLFSAESNADIKLGAAYSAGPKKTGFDMAVSYDLGIDKYFALGIQPGFHWLNYDVSTGVSSTLNGTISTNTLISQNVYSIPVLMNLIVRIPLQIGVTPYFAPGAGYGWTFMKASSSSQQYDGLVWQLMAGAAFSLGGNNEWGGEGSAFQIIVEFGYRGYEPTLHGANQQVIMSGAVAHIGARFSLGGGGSNTGWN